MKQFNAYHPLFLISYFFSVICITMFVWNPVLQLISLLGAILYTSVGLNKEHTKNDAVFYIVLFLLISITNPVFSHNGVTPLFYMNGNAITLEAFVYGAAIAIAVISVILWFRIFSDVFSTDKFLYLFGRSIPQLSLVLSMALRFVPTYLRQFKRSVKVCKTLGVFSEKGILNKISSYLKVFSSLVGWALENAVDTQASMKSRGYGLMHRTSFSLFRLNLSDCVMVVFSLFLTVIIVGLIANGKSNFFYYPVISTIDTSFGAVILYITFAVQALLPFLIQITENIKWKYYESKI